MKEFVLQAEIQKKNKNPKNRGIWLLYEIIRKLGQNDNKPYIERADLEEFSEIYLPGRIQGNVSDFLNRLMILVKIIQIPRIYSIMRA